MLDDKKSGADKRMLSVTQNYHASSIGKNYKGIDEKLQVIKQMGQGSKVKIVSGSHQGLDGKIVAISK